MDELPDSSVKLSAELVRNLRRDNPWWEGKPSIVLPKTRRTFVETIHKKLRQNLAPIVTVRGPRQVGKSTAQLQIIEDLLKSGISGKRIFRVQCDEIPSMRKYQEPILRLTEWYETSVLGRTLNESAHLGEPVYLFWDEVQNLKDWAPQLKHLVDGSTCRVLVTGSSALRIELGRDSLAGRITSLDVGPLGLSEIAAVNLLGDLPVALQDNGLHRLADQAFWHELVQLGRDNSELRDIAFSMFSLRGGYPVAQTSPDVPWAEIADQLNETVIRRVIQHDLRVGERGRKRDAALLEELFRLSCRYAGQCPSPSFLAKEVQQSLGGNIGTQRVQHYLRFLNDTLLLRLVPSAEIRLKRTKGWPKICLADHGLRASWLQEIVPLDPLELANNPHLSDLAGHIAESVAGSFLLTIQGMDLSHCPERSHEPEVDFVMTLGTKRVPLEIKCRRRIDPQRDTEGLRAFIEKSVNNAPFGILVTQTDDVTLADPRIVAIPLSTLLMMK